MIRALVNACRCVYLRNRAQHLERTIAETDRHFDAWPVVRECWQREASLLRQQVDHVCGTKRGTSFAVRSLLPKDKRV